MVPLPTIRITTFLRISFLNNAAVDGITTVDALIVSS